MLGSLPPSQPTLVQTCQFLCKQIDASSQGASGVACSAAMHRLAADSNTSCAAGLQAKRRGTRQLTEGPRQGGCIKVFVGQL